MNRNEQAIVQAYALAARDLRACYNPDGIVAGRTHFNSYWSRDGFWGAFGALELRDYDQARRQLELFIKHQKPSGQMPVRIEFLSHTFGRYHGMRQRLAPIFRAAHLANPFDPTALFVICAWQYFRHTSDREFLREHFFAIAHAARWLLGLADSDGLIKTGLLADWMDSVIRPGKILYTNVIYGKAMEDFGNICELLRRYQDGKTAQKRAEQTKQSISQKFWDGNFFVDRVSEGKRALFSADGNVLAMIYDIASPNQSRAIVEFVKNHNLETTIGLHTTFPRYPWYQIMPQYFGYGIPDYHTRLIWPWITSLYGLAKWRLGLKASALESLGNTARLFLARSAVAEVYEPTGVPLRRLIYQSEIPFAWNAAAFVYAVKSIGLAGKHQVMIK